MEKRACVVIVLSILVLTGVTCTGGGLFGPSPGQTIVEILHQGNERAYILYVPETYKHGQEMPLVLSFHGTGSSASVQEAYSGLDALAETHNVLVAYPEGLPLDGKKVFDAGLRDFSSAPRDDVDFARAIVTDVASRASVDLKRVYATGMSNGARMSYRIACEAADLVAAIAPVAGGLSLSPEACLPSRPVPALHFHGTADTVAPYYEVGAYTTIPVPDMFFLWAEKTGCTGDPAVTFQEDDVTCETYSACSDGAEVTFCTIMDGAHCWPGNPNCYFGYSTETIDAGEQMLEFFSEFQLP